MFAPHRLCIGNTLAPKRPSLMSTNQGGARSARCLMPFGSIREWTVVMACSNLSEITTGVNKLNTSDAGGKFGWSTLDVLDWNPAYLV